MPPNTGSEGGGSSAGGRGSRNHSGSDALAGVGGGGNVTGGLGSGSGSSAFTQSRWERFLWGFLFHLMWVGCCVAACTLGVVDWVQGESGAGVGGSVSLCCCLPWVPQQDFYACFLTGPTWTRRPATVCLHPPLFLLMFELGLCARAVCGYRWLVNWCSAAFTQQWHHCTR